MAYAHHVTPSKSPEVVEAPCEQNFKRDGGGDGLLFSEKPNAPTESDGADAGDLSPCTPSPLPHHSPAPPQQSFGRLGDARGNSLESIPQPEFLDTSQGLQSKETISSSHSDTPDINPAEKAGPASVVSDVSVHDVVISHDKANRIGLFTRTRTGCLSCRRRKKKCDEHRPSCEYSPFSSGITRHEYSSDSPTHVMAGVNCLRLNLYCEGYDPGPRRMEPRPTPSPTTMGRNLGAEDTTLLALAQQSERYGSVSSDFLPNKCLSHSDEYHKKPKYLPRLAELDWPTLGKGSQGGWPLKLTDVCGRQSSLLTEAIPRPIQPSNPRPISYCPRALPTYASLPQPLEPSILYGSDIAQQPRLRELPSPLRRLTELYDLSSAGRELCTHRE
ncbi:uncharacterized protein PV06_11075 [Exophiala oligosperma]|uniref:Zn(2)-C6 fungal-type domain-containing protein n=1 Tax=Exophiala oligosperma TaxID=215243 RepID=A0A0D2BGP7_9EURO|nr:uncharacterized protein PV06_11075 [Exophiala oligosperma]KIW36657.1 hypothetical protein PV06_11075 [Exophiala oligosperma]